ncbi:rod shape-determining protein RodA [Candidatus Pelagibacter communis]|uniref:rod shape-determining protein RodA n=1 Tax=Pelagibacter ubique TaxID=198252 RepID=UPI00094CAE38|nr:rod shape-determining protein RodA [Candidatus Pelagibacter ubique]|tara:strand:- start:529 stop:1653 length:1125 start_codon:yes stop_codon:yes gene_type:complete
MYLKSKLENKNNFLSKIKNIDLILFVSILLLGFISLATMYSTDGGEILFHTKSHFTKFVIFTFLMLAISFLNIRFWFSLGYLGYLVIIVMLIWTINFGITASGSQRWINLYYINIQPSELMKIFIILCLAKFFHRKRLETVNSFYSVIISLIIIFLPMSLVIIQPDLGTSLLISISGIIVLWFAGLNNKYFFYSILISVLSLPFIISFLKPYQKLRVLTFLNPDRDPLGAGYQIIQSKIAVGSGGLFGKGYLKGTQSYLEFLPEKHTDFIFTLFSEEFGFVGSVFLLLLYAVIIYRIIKIGALSRSYFAKLFCYSFGVSMFVYIVINMSMVLGLLPIVGSPLPIMSYGGSSMLATMIGFGIVMSAKIHSDQSIA